MANLEHRGRHRSPGRPDPARDRGPARWTSASRTAETIWGEKVVLLPAETQAAPLLSLDQLWAGDRVGERTMGRASCARPFGMLVVSGPTGSGEDDDALLTPRSRSSTRSRRTSRRSRTRSSTRSTTSTRSRVIRKVANLTFAKRAARHPPAAGPRRHPDRRGPRHRDGRDRDPVGADRPPRAVLRARHGRRRRDPAVHRDWASRGFLISSALIGVAAQRLVRRICGYCNEPYEPSADERRLWLRARHRRQGDLLSRARHARH